MIISDEPYSGCSVCTEIWYSRLLSVLNCIEIQYSRCFVLPCSAVARALLCVSCLCWSSRHTCHLPVFSLEIHFRKVSNAEASQLKERVNWKASRATSGAACFSDVRISGVADQVGNLELSWCRPGGTWQLVLSRAAKVFGGREVNCR